MAYEAILVVDGLAHIQIFRVLLPVSDFGGGRMVTQPYPSACAIGAICGDAGRSDIDDVPDCEVFLVEYVVDACIVDAIDNDVG